MQIATDKPKAISQSAPIKPASFASSSSVSSVELIAVQRYLKKPLAKKNAKRAKNIFIACNMSELGNNRLAIIKKLHDSFGDIHKYMSALKLHDDTHRRHVHIAIHCLGDNNLTLDEVSEALGIDKQNIWIWRGYSSNMFSYLCHQTSTASAYKKRFSYDGVWANFDFAAYMANLELHVKAHYDYYQRYLNKFVKDKITEVELFEKIGILAYDKYYYRVSRAIRVKRKAQHLEFLKDMQNRPTYIAVMDNAPEEFKDDPDYFNVLSQHVNDSSVDTYTREKLAIRNAELNDKESFRIIPEYGYGDGYKGERVVIVDCKKIASAKNTLSRRRIMQFIKDSFEHPAVHDYFITAHHHKVPLNCEVLVLIDLNAIIDELSLPFDCSLKGALKASLDPSVRFKYYGFTDDYVNLETSLDTLKQAKKGQIKKLSAVRNTNKKAKQNEILK